MSSEDSVTQWIAQLKVGDDAAVQKLWERYFKRLVGLSRKILETTPRRAADEEDVALSAFKSFCQRAEQQKFPQLEDRDDIWKLLITITARKAIRQMRREAVRPIVNEADFLCEQISDQEPTPQFAALVKDECQRLLETLGDESLKQIALWKLEAYKNREIAEKLGRSISFVERKLQIIRRLWENGDG